MNPSEMARALKFVSSFDNRTVTTEATVAWSTVMQDVELGEAQAAIARHYGTSQDWLMPARLRELVGELRAEQAVVRYQLEMQTHERSRNLPANCQTCRRHYALGYTHGCTDDPCRHCPWPNCSCTHTDGCDRGVIDLGEIDKYDKAQQCPVCQVAAKAWPTIKAKAMA